MAPVPEALPLLLLLLLLKEPAGLALDEEGLQGAAGGAPRPRSAAVMRSSMAVRLGYACQMPAASPQTMGEENEVPLLIPMPSGILGL